MSRLLLFFLALICCNVAFEFHMWLLGSTELHSLRSLVLTVLAFYITSIWSND